MEVDQRNEEQMNVVLPVLFLYFIQLLWLNVHLSCETYSDAAVTCMLFEHRPSVGVVQSQGEYHKKVLH